MVQSILRGIKNNNPGNLRFTGTKWKGLKGQDSKGFCIFDTPENGLRAAALNVFFVVGILQNAKKPINLENFGDLWAPVSDNPGSTPGQYGRDLAKTMGVSSTATMDLTDQSVMALLLPAIVKNENGIFPAYSAQVYASGISAARQYKGLA